MQRTENMERKRSENLLRLPGLLDGVVVVQVVVADGVRGVPVR